MQGFILDLRRVREEDLIVTIITKDEIRDYYRFFGARHSILQLGYLIDFEVEESIRYLPRARKITHIGFKWIYDREKMLLWQRFIKNFKIHLKDIEKIDPFYFNIIFESAKKWEKENPKRVICESYIKMLHFEGRIHPLNQCYICQKEIINEVAFMHALLPAHPECINSFGFNKKIIETLFSSKSTIYLDDNIIEALYPIILKGF